MLDPWAGKIPWRSKWQPTSVFLPGEPHGQRSLAGCSPQGHKRVRHDLATEQQQHTPHQSCLFLQTVVGQTVTTRWEAPEWGCWGERETPSTYILWTYFWGNFNWMATGPLGPECCWGLLGLEHTEWAISSVIVRNVKMNWQIETQPGRQLG